MSRYLEAALEIGGELAAAPGASEGIWHGDALVPDGEAGHIVEHGDVGADLYGGAAGIGMVLAHLASVSSDPTLTYTARAALARALGDSERMLESGKLSLYGGATGIALGVNQGARAISDLSLAKGASDLAGKICDVVAGMPLDEVDLISGSAGVVLGLLALDNSGSDARIGAASASLCRGLVARSRAGWWGRSLASPAGIALCGLGHGAAGIGWAMVECGSRIGDAEMATAGTEVLRYEDSWFETAAGTWPDLRAREEVASAPLGWMDAWCHGAIGIGIVRWHLFGRTGDPHLLAQATAAMWAARRLVVAAARQQPPEVADMTLCHGLAGTAELMLISYEVTRLHDHLRAARRVGDLILKLRYVNGGVWTVGLPGGKDVPGLFLGRAGIAATMLRLHELTLMPSPALAGQRMNSDFS